MKNIKTVFAVPHNHIVNTTATYKLEQRDYDRTIFITTDFYGNIIGLNYHQGIDPKLQEEYLAPCPYITEIFNRIPDGAGKKPINIINRAIELYIKTFIFSDEH